MSNIPIWSGSGGAISGSTPFGFYDSDTEFQDEGPKVAVWIAQRLGFPIHNVELQDINIYAAFEEAITTYSNEVYQYKIRDNYLSMEGNITSSRSWNNQLITPNMGTVVRIAEQYASEAGTGGNITFHTGSFQVTAGVQDYDLSDNNLWASGSGITGSIEIKRLFYEQSPALVRYFDPYSGIGTQSLLGSFGFGNTSPGINFTLMPVYFDLQVMQGIEFNDQVRRSAYSFDLVNNKLRIFPVPTSDYIYYFHYIMKDDRNSVINNNLGNAASGSGGTNLITNISNVPYTNPVYSQINDLGKQWIRHFTLTIAKEMLGYIRGKYQTIPIPGDSVILNSNDLLTSAKEEKIALLEKLRLDLDETSRKMQLEKRAAEVESMQAELNKIPLMVYIF